MRVALPIETKGRELFGKIWLALNMVSHDHEVIIGEKGQIKTSIGFIKPDIFFDKCASHTPSRVEFYDKLKRSGILIGYLDAEGIAYPQINNKEKFPSMDYYYKHRLSNETLKKIDCIFAWGEAHSEKIKKESNFPDEYNIISGNPRFDLLNPDYRSVYNKNSNNIKDKYGDFILVTTSFIFGNPYDKSFRRESVDEHFKLLKQEGYDFHGREIFEEKLTKEYIDAIDHLSDKIDKTIVFRPHPTEDHQRYKTALSDKENVCVEYSGDVREFIIPADATIHHTSATGIESAWLGTPAISYRPIQNDKFEGYLPKEVSISATSKKELTDILTRHRLNNKHILTEEQSAVLKQYCHNYGGNAAKIISKSLDQIETIDSNYSEFTNTKDKLKRQMKDVPIFNKIFTYRTYSNYKKQKFPGISKDEIMEITQEFESFINIDNVNIEEVKNIKDCVVIESRT